MPRWTSHFRSCGSSSSSSCALGDIAGLGPDPTALFYYFINKSTTNSFIEPAAWLIVLALVDKLYLEHFTLYNTLHSTPKRLTAREAAIAAFGVRLYTGHTLRNLFVLFVLAHKWHGECYFTIKYFLDFLPTGLRKGTVHAQSASSPASVSSAGPIIANRQIPPTPSMPVQVPTPAQQLALEPVELASIEEGFLRLLGYNLSIAPQSILRLADYFLSLDEKAMIVNFVANSSVQKKFSVVL
jgi:hypothetical protein